MYGQTSKLSYTFLMKSVPCMSRWDDVILQSLAGERKRLFLWQLGKYRDVFDIGKTLNYDSLTALSLECLSLLDILFKFKDRPKEERLLWKVQLMQSLKNHKLQNCITNSNYCLHDSKESWGPLSDFNSCILVFWGAN